MNRLKAFELDDKELVFLDIQLQFVLDSLEETREAIIVDRSLTMEQLLKTDPSIGENIDRCNELIGRVQREMNDRGIGRD